MLGLLTLLVLLILIHQGSSFAGLGVRVSTRFVSTPARVTWRAAQSAQGGEDEKEEAQDEFDVEKVLQDIAEEKDKKKAAETQKAIDERNAVLQKRKSRNYEKYWAEQESKDLVQGVKDQATLRSYYGGGSRMSNNNATAVVIAEEKSQQLWNYQAVPVNPAKGDGVAVSAVGLAVLATFIVGKKLLVDKREGRTKSSRQERPVRNAINMPGIGIVFVD